jgi:hypothetical protein
MFMRSFGETDVMTICTFRVVAALHCNQFGLEWPLAVAERGAASVDHELHGERCQHHAEQP